MKDIQQLIKKNSQEGRYEDIFPKTFTDAVKDKESGKSLIDILSSFNMYFLSYNGSREQTRLQVPMSIRKTGLWVTYVLYDKTVVTEWYAGEAIDDDSWKSPDNWRVGTNMLVGDISISSDGYWVINGAVTTTKAQGEQGITPMLRVGSNNHLQVSYTNGSSWVDVSTNPVYTQFRINNNKLEQSVDLGQTWTVVSDYIASWFRFTGTTGSSQNVGKIQISRDNGVTWSDLSGEFTNSFHIKGYVATVGALPSSAVQGDIYGVGPTYDPSDTGQTNPIYQLYVKDSTGWVNNGKFTSIAAGVVQTTGTSTTEVMSQDAVSKEFVQVETELSILDETINGKQKNIINTENVDVISGQVINKKVPINILAGNVDITVVDEDHTLPSGISLIFYGQDGVTQLLSKSFFPNQITPLILASDMSFVQFYAGGANIPEANGKIYLSVSSGIETNGIVADFELFKNSIGITYEVIPISRYGAHIPCNTAVIGSPFSANIPAKPLNPTGNNCYKIQVLAGETYKIYGYGNGDVGSLYVLTGNNNIVLDKKTLYDSRTNPIILYIVENGFLYSNQIDALTTDKIEKEKIPSLVEILDSAKQYTDEQLNSFRESPLKNKKIVFLGDSMTEFTDINNKSWVDYFSDYCGAHCINIAFGGTRLAERIDGVNGQKWSGLDIINVVNSICSQDYLGMEQAIATLDSEGSNYYLNRYTTILNRIKAIDWNSVDAVIIEGGGNDWLGEQNVGNENDMDKTTVLGAVNLMIKQLLTTYPHLHLFFISNQLLYCTPEPFSPDKNYNIGDICYYSGRKKFINAHLGEWNSADVIDATLLDCRIDDLYGDIAVRGGNTQRELINKIKSVSVANHIPYCSLYDELGWNKYNFSQYYPDDDNSHPKKGFHLYARKVLSFIESNLNF